MCMFSGISVEYGDGIYTYMLCILSHKPSTYRLLNIFGPNLYQYRFHMYLYDIVCQNDWTLRGPEPPANRDPSPGPNHRPRVNQSSDDAAGSLMSGGHPKSTRILLTSLRNREHDWGCLVVFAGCNRYSFMGISWGFPYSRGGIAPTVSSIIDTNHPLLIPIIHYWYQSSIIDTNHPLLIPIIHYWYQSSIIDANHPLLIPIIHYWYQSSIIDTNHPLLIPIIHYWYQSYIYISLYHVWGV